MPMTPPFGPVLRPAPSARRYLALGLVAILLTACAPIQPTAPADWRARQQAVDGIDRFLIEGRVAARGPVSGSANLRWQQDAQDYSLRLSGPFGAGAMLIDGSPQGVRVRHKDQTLFTQDPEATLRAELGWTLPVDQLRWWILGLPAPDEPAQMDFDAHARLARLQQNGWTVDYQEYRAAASLSPVFDLPRRLELAQGDLRLRVLVDQWQGLPTGP